MASILYIGTHGTDNPNKATFPFFLARGAVEAGHQPAIMLMMDGVLLMKDAISQSIHGVGLPMFKEVMDYAVQHRVPITV
jgi:predicted peroxiredoxin